MSILLRCLMVQQPYASLIAFGRKRWEFRSYETDKRGKIGIGASPSPSLLTKNADLNAVSGMFPKGVLLATADLTNCFFVTASDLRKARNELVHLTIHGRDILTLDSPLGEPQEDVDLAIRSNTWESFAWGLENVRPIATPVAVEKRSRSTWVSVDYDE